MAVKKFKIIHGSITTDVKDAKTGKAGLVKFERGEILEIEESKLGGCATQCEEVKPGGAEPVQPVAPKIPFVLKKDESIPNGQPQFSVLNVTTGLPINEKPLVKAEADALLAQKLAGAQG